MKQGSRPKVYFTVRCWQNKGELTSVKEGSKIKIRIVSKPKRVLKPSLCMVHHRVCDLLLFIHLAIICHGCDQSALFCLQLFK